MTPKVNPAQSFESFRLVDTLGVFGNDNPPVVVDSVLNPILYAGSQYWVIVSPSVNGAAIVWATGDVATTPSERADGYGSEPWVVHSVDFTQTGAFSISGTIAAVPEAGTTQIASALLLLFAARRRK